MAELPVIDLSVPGGDKAFTESLRHFGFAVLRNHPLDMKLVKRIYGQWATFFSSDEKNHYPFDRYKQDGYFSIETAESAKGQEQQDYKEYFHFYPWGRCPAELRDDLMVHYRDAQNFAATLLGWVEDYSPLEVANNYSEPLPHMIAGSENSLLRILSYPPTLGKSGLIRAAAHEDINLLTILPSADAPGLQVLDKGGEWLNVPSDNDQVIVNIGDMLQEASNGYFPSTTHRVVNAGTIDDGKVRMSCPMFLHPRLEVKLSDRYTAGGYLAERLNELGVI